MRYDRDYQRPEERKHQRGGSGSGWGRIEENLPSRSAACTERRRVREPQADSVKGVLKGKKVQPWVVRKCCPPGQCGESRRSEAGERGWLWVGWGSAGSKGQPAMPSCLILSSSPLRATKGFQEEKMSCDCALETYM